MQGRVVVPIHDEKGELVAYAGRAIDTAEPKYRFPRGFRKGLELFNLHRAKTKGREVIVVEGFFDALQVHQAGYPNVVALMGTTLTQPQLEKLAANFESAVLMLDGDGPGRAASVKVADQLGRRIAVRVLTPPDGKQPDQLSAAEMRQILSAREPRPGMDPEAKHPKVVKPGLNRLSAPKR
jgi:DNA primase